MTTFVLLRIEDDGCARRLIEDMREYPDDALLTPVQENTVPATLIAAAPFVTDLTIGGDDYLAIVERQRDEALATIERVKNVIRSERIENPRTFRALDRAYSQGRQDVTAAFRAAIDADLATVRVQADAETEAE